MVTISYLSLNTVFIVRDLQVFIVISKSKRALKCLSLISQLAAKISPELFISLFISTIDLTGGLQYNIEIYVPYQLSESYKILISKRHLILRTLDKGSWINVITFGKYCKVVLRGITKVPLVWHQIEHWEADLLNDDI